jgi:helix-turn-helix protein
MPTTVEIPATVFPTWREEPAEGTLTLGADSVGVAAGEWDHEAAFADVFDVRLGPPPHEVDRRFEGETLTVGVERDGERAVVFASGDDDDIQRFGRLLYRRLLDGTAVAVRHPAAVGGRVARRRFDTGTLQVAPAAVGVTGIEAPFVVDIESVVDFSRRELDVRGETRRVIEIQYVRDGTVVTLDLSIDSPRSQQLLGRYLRLEYADLRRELEGLDLPGAAGELLVRLYALEGSAPAETLVEGHPQSRELLGKLAACGLVTRGDDVVELTPRGWVLVTEQVGPAPPDAVPGSASESA